MLKHLYIENFRGFSEHEIYFKPKTIVVGQNNAGKSTLVEALRIISIVSNRYKNLAYHPVPDWLDIPGRHYGVSPSLKSMEINFESIFFRYGSPPSRIIASFDDNSSISVYLGEKGKIHSVITDQRGKIINSRHKAYNVTLPSIRIMHQVAPVQRIENCLSEDYVKSAVSSSLAPLHFRNQLYYFSSLFDEFRELVQETWPKVDVVGLMERGVLSSDPLVLQIRIEDFVAEIAEMGHGLQMWLQTMWFLTRSKNVLTIILDEPAVYMHPDLQRRLVRLLYNRHKQLILTTHSVEIMSEVEPDEILVIERKRKKSIFARSLPAVQKIIETVGSVHNLNLVRLSNSRRIIFVEGKDLKILKILHAILFPMSNKSLDMIPNMSIGGWGGWSYAVGSSMLLENALGEDIITYCVLDSDYHTEQQIQKRKDEANKRGVSLHIWSHKEIENFLIKVKPIQRLINENRARRTKGPTLKEIKVKIDNFSKKLYDELFDGLSSEILSENRSLGQGGANKATRRILDEIKNKYGSLLPAVSGKRIISVLSEWSNAEFGVSFNSSTIARSIKDYEIDEEVKMVVSSIENIQPFR